MEKNIRYAIIVVVIIVVIAIGYVFMSSGSMPVSGQIGTPVSNAQLSLQLKTIAMNDVLADNVGIGSTANGGNPNYPLSINNSTALVVNGKVGVVYIGADFCPYCAINRWGLVIALMRFGNFTGLKYMQSGAHDVYASTATFTFENSSYVSDSVYFDPVETADINGNVLSTPDPLQMALMKEYDKSGNIPFTVFGNKSILVGPMATPQSIQSSNWAQIIAQLNDTNSPVSQALIGSANIFTAYICRTGLASIGNAGACQQTYVKSINGA